MTFARTELLRQVRAAAERVWLASPFLSAPIAEQIAGSSAAAANGRRLLTALVPGSVQVGALDPKALRILKQSGFEIASIRNLHAKLSLVDSSWGLLGSGNLTNAGLGSTTQGNVELGVVLSREQIQSAAALFAEWWQEASPISDEKLEEFDALPRISGGAKSGLGDFGPALDPSGTDELDLILAEDAAAASSRGYWIKANYHRARRDDREWWRRDWISDWRRPSYRVGDLIVLYMSARDEGPRCCPAIVRVSRPPREDRDWVISHGDAGAADQWPFVTETTCVADVPIPLGVPLSTMDVVPQALQGGYCQISREQFERAARAMRG